MAELTIRLKKNKDGSASLTCTRADGSVTWQKQEGQLGAIFPQHDLTHFAVESALGYTDAFFGLVADGWDLSDFGAPWRRGPVTVNARQVENLVAGFDMDGRQGFAADADAFNSRIGDYLRGVKRPEIAPLQRILTGEEIERVRALRSSLLERWSALVPGEAMELEFDRHAVER